MEVLQHKFSKSVALDKQQYSKLNKIYLNKIKNNQSFDKLYLNLHRNRLIFQRLLVEYDFKYLKNKIKKFLYIILLFIYFCKIKTQI